MDQESLQNPWTHISSKKVYENPWITLIEDEVLLPNKKEGIYGKVHFKNNAVGIIPLDGELNTWLVGQYRYMLDAYSWEIPMGGAPLDEDTLVGAKRELKEETGLIANKWTNILSIHTSNSVTDEFGYVYLAQELIQGDIEWDETEELEIRKLPLAEALEMVMQNKITDSLSIAGILKAVRILGV